MFSYKATKTGLLSDPYQLVKEGEIVNSATELKINWLVPLEEYKAAPELPITPKQTIAGANVERVNVAPVPERADYNAQMEKVKELETAQDANKTAPEAPAQQSTGGAGTGNQDVLG